MIAFSILSSATFAAETSTTAPRTKEEALVAFEAQSKELSAQKVALDELQARLAERKAAAADRPSTAGTVIRVGLGIMGLKILSSIRGANLAPGDGIYVLSALIYGGGLTAVGAAEVKYQMSFRIAEIAIPRLEKAIQIKRAEIVKAEESLQVNRELLTGN